MPRPCCTSASVFTATTLSREAPWSSTAGQLLSGGVSLWTTGSFADASRMKSCTSDIPCIHMYGNGYSTLCVSVCVWGGGGCGCECGCVSSARVGCTGTFVTVDYCMEQREGEGQVDIFNFVHQMKYMRNYMVQTQVSGHVCFGRECECVRREEVWSGVSAIVLLTRLLYLLSLSPPPHPPLPPLPHLPLSSPPLPLPPPSAPVSVYS